jgi:hypothetical protein
VVTLSRHDKKTSESEIVRLEAEPPYYLPSAAEARHWGATYALYRVRLTTVINTVWPFSIVRSTVLQRHPAQSRPSSWSTRILERSCGGTQGNLRGQEMDV